MLIFILLVVIIFKKSRKLAYTKVVNLEIYATLGIIAYYTIIYKLLSIIQNI